MEMQCLLTSIEFPKCNQFFRKFISVYYVVKPFLFRYTKIMALFIKHILSIFVKIEQSFHKTFSSSLIETVRYLTLKRKFFLFHNDFLTSVK
jgi:hypothetical protein